MKTFEYQVIRLTRDSNLSEDLEDLDIYGKEGWELVAVCPSTVPGFSAPVAYLKREKRV